MEEIHKLERKNYCLQHGLPWAEDKESDADKPTNLEVPTSTLVEHADASLSSKRSKTSVGSQKEPAKRIGSSAKPPRQPKKKKNACIMKKSQPNQAVRQSNLIKSTSAGEMTGR